VDEKLPQIREEAKRGNGVLTYVDEASFKVSGTSSRGWMRRGEGREVPSKPGRESVKAFGAVTAQKNPRFHFRFADTFNSLTFIKFLEQLIRQYPDNKLHLILDNASYHHAEYGGLQGAKQRIIAISKTVEH